MGAGVLPGPRVISMHDKTMPLGLVSVVRAEHVVLFRSLASGPSIYIGHFQISSFFHEF